MVARRPGGDSDSRSAGSEITRLIREHLAGGREEDARLVLVKATSDSIYRYLLRMLRDRPAAEDVFQDTYIRAFRALPWFRGDSSPTTWVLTISRNLALNRIRRERTESRRRVEVDEPPDVADPGGPVGGGDIGEAASEALRNKRLLGALARLTPPQRESVILYYLEDKPVEEVARITGRPANTIKSDLRRARQALQDSLGGGETTKR